MTTNIDKYADIIDSRDVISRIEELESDASTECEHCNGRGTLLPSPTDPQDFIEECPECEGSGQVGAGLDEDDAAELAALKALAEEAEGYTPDWTYGATLIRDSYFQTYAEELADDIGAINREQAWPLNCIDWAQAARELQQDYTAVDFDGVTYWVR